MKVTKTVCDNCAAEIKDIENNYCEVIVKTKEHWFTDAAGSKDYNQGRVSFEFCYSCVRHRLIPALERLAGKDGE